MEPEIDRGANAAEACAKAPESLADRMLKGHESALTVTVFGHVFPLWKAVEFFARIQNKNDEDVPFRYNYQQCRLYLAMAKAKEEGRQIRINILKARQIGFSTMIDVQLAIQALFTPNLRAGILADTEDHASGLFEKIQYVYDHLDHNNPARKLIEDDPKANGRYSWKPKLKYNKGQKLLRTAEGNSVVEVMCVSDTSGRSKHYTMIHCSEVAFWKQTEKALLSLFKTVSRHNPNSCIFLETTANGYNDYKLRWDRDFAGGDASFDAFFAPWFDNPEYRDDVPLGYDLKASMDQWEIDKQIKFGLRDDQMYWFHQEYLDANRNKDFVLQEDPFEPSDAFISTGNAVFDKDITEMRKSEIIAEERSNEGYRCGSFTCKHPANEDQTRIDVLEDTIRWIDSRGGPIKIFQEPIPGHPYVVTCDPNMGGSDDIAMQVMDNYTGRQVARFKSNVIKNDEAVWQLYCLGRMYNWALVSSENNVGQIILVLLEKSNYPKIYITQSESYQNYNRTLKTQLGHKTTVANRQFMIDSAVRAFREDPKTISDYDTICEMESFQLNEHFDKDGNVTRAKQEATGGAHDDLVMAWAAFYIVRQQQRATPIDPEPKSKKGSFRSCITTMGNANAVFPEARKPTQNEILNRSIGIKW